VAERRGDVGREAQFLAEEIDPIAQQVMDTADPWKAYKGATAAPEALVNAMDWMPHGGRIYVAWAELTDLYDAGKVPISEAHAALRQAASDWLDRPEPTADAFIDGWLSRTLDAITALLDRYGDFWQSRGQQSGVAG